MLRAGTAVRYWLSSVNDRYSQRVGLHGAVQDLRRRDSMAKQLSDRSESAGPIDPHSEGSEIAALSGVQPSGEDILGVSR